MAPVPADHPLMIAWKAYEATPEYENTARWVVKPEHTKGSLWAAFVAGWTARQQAEAPQTAPRDGSTPLTPQPGAHNV